MLDDKKLFFIIESETGFIDGWYKFIDQETFELDSLDLCLMWDEKRPQYNHLPCVLDNDKGFYIPDDMHLPRQSLLESKSGFILKKKEAYEQGVRNMANALVEAVVNICGDHAISIQNLVNISDEISGNNGFTPESVYKKYSIASQADGNKIIHLPPKRQQ